MSWLSSRSPALAGLSLATLLTFGCEPPPVVPTEAPQQTQAARIEGNVVVQGPARGNAVVFLYDADRPPPPRGTGRPLSFAIIRQEELFGSALDSPDAVGPFTAPFLFDTVPPGRYLLRGFIDTDTCRAGAQPCHGPDFIPWYTVTGEPNVGDVAGAALVAPDSRELRVVEVGTSAGGTPLPVLGVTVSFSHQATVKADRPVFEVVGPSRLEAGGSPLTLRLSARPIREGVVDLRAPVFLVHYRDEDGNGAPEDSDGDGAWDLWPRVVVRKLAGSAGLADENDLDSNGVLDDTGVDYPHLDGTQDQAPDLVVLHAGLIPNAFVDQLTDEGGTPRMNTVLPVSELIVGVRPLAYDARNPLAPAPLKALPSGRYAVIVIQSSGQVWRVPNELSPGLAENLGLPPVGSQAFTLEVP